MAIPDYQLELSALQRNIITAGADEAGRGPLAGPVVAAVVCLAPECPELPGLNDSKKMTATNRYRLYDIIHEKSNSIGISVIDVEVIDTINILHATIKAINEAANKIKPVPDFLLVDGNYFYSNRFKFSAIVKGDSKSMSIAAASVIAKVTRDRIMMKYAEIYPEYGFDRHKGYATKLHFERIREHGLSPIHRKLFLRKFFNRQEVLL